jgi:hypothetical protein
LFQGTFGCYEKFSSVSEFVDSHLAAKGFPFVLADPISASPLPDDRSLGDLKLAPAAVVHFEWDADVLVGWTRTGQPIRYLDYEEER